jgi:hypothetical protein
MKKYSMETNKAQLERKRNDNRREREKYWIGYEREYGRQESDKAQLKRIRAGSEKVLDRTQESTEGKKVTKLSLEG